MQVKQFFEFWRLSRLDAFVWLATFLTVIIVAIDIGLAVGIALSLTCIFIRGMKPYTCLLGNVPKTDFYLDISRYKAVSEKWNERRICLYTLYLKKKYYQLQAEEINFIKIFHYCGSLNFASRSSFKSELCTLIGLNLAKETRKMAKSIENPDQKVIKIISTKKPQDNHFMAMLIR